MCSFYQRFCILCKWCRHDCFTCVHPICAASSRIMAYAHFSLYLYALFEDTKLDCNASSSFSFGISLSVVFVIWVILRLSLCCALVKREHHIYLRAMVTAVTSIRIWRVNKMRQVVVLFITWSSWMLWHEEFAFTRDDCWKQFVCAVSYCFGEHFLLSA